MKNHRIRHKIETLVQLYASIHYESVVWNGRRFIPTAFIKRWRVETLREWIERGVYSVEKKSDIQKRRIRLAINS